MAITKHIKKECCGCGACASRCPKEALSMKSDKEGFLYPSLDKSACVECGICESVCPVLNVSNDSRQPIESVAAVSNDDETRLGSSSGGIFSELAKWAIAQDGVVFGAGFDEDWRIVHSFTENVDGLARLRRSKYAQSVIGDCFKQAETFLKQGRTVLFSGTPCQISGLKHFLRKDYPGLIAVEVICHGVPSPKIWEDYVREVSKKGRITRISFRDKSTGWRKYSVTFEGEDAIVQKRLSSEDPYIKAFLGDYSLRPSCYDCKAKSGKSGADICLGDFWGIKESAFDDNKGISAVMAFTEKGLSAIRALDVKAENHNFNSIVSGNPSLVSSARRPVLRSLFWHKYVSKGIGAINEVEALQHKKVFRVFMKIRRLIIK